MNVVIINKSDTTGGAAIVSFRLMQALRFAGIEASMLVVEKLTDSPFVQKAAPDWCSKMPFFAERLRLILQMGVNRQNLFQLDPAYYGLPLYKHPLVQNADIICLNWVNQGMLSLHGLQQLLSLGKPVVWTMHDMWCFTGVCHHAGTCRKFESKCGDCPLLNGEGSPRDVSAKTMERKQRTYKDIHFVAVSNWLADLARKSHLLRNSPLSVIHNAFPVTDPIDYSNDTDRFRIIFGAARIDDPVKGLPILVEVTRILHDEYPDDSRRMELVTFGNIKDPTAVSDIKIAHRHLGRINDPNKVREIYRNGDVVVSTSHYETLPGTLVEGQMFGCLPVAFNRGGQSDIIEHCETGYLAAWNDDILQAALNIANGIIWAYRADRKIIRQKMHRSAIEKFDGKVIAKKYMDLFSTLTESQKNEAEKSK